MNIKFNPTQCNRLSVAMQREDRCFEAPVGWKASAAQAFAVKLIDAGYAREIRTKGGLPVWRRDKEADQDYSLKLTALGVKIAKERAGSTEASANTRSKNASPAHRESSKLSKVIAMLSEEGATIEEISKAMGWLEHTTRAVLTGLRKRGFNIIREAREGESRSGYRIEALAQTNQAA
jgi:hypothetical protein